MWIPVSLVILRCAIAPFLLWDAWDGRVSPVFLVAYGIAVMSDIFDGIIARRLDVSTEGLRTADSWADRWLYLCVAIAAWRTHAEVILDFREPLLTVVGLQGMWWVVNLAKYGRPASYHTYSAKAWGLSLISVAIALFGYNTGGLMLWIAIILGCFHTLEEIMMTLLLPTWHHDVLSIVHAFRLRRLSHQP